MRRRNRRIDPRKAEAWGKGQRGVVKELLTGSPPVMTCYCSETSTRNCPVHQNGNSRLRRTWIRIKYLDQLLLDGYRTFRLPMLRRRKDR